MKQILFAIAVMMFTATSCSKPTTARLCGKVVSSRVCGVCAAQPSFIVDVYFPQTGETIGFPVERAYSKGEEYCR